MHTHRPRPALRGEHARHSGGQIAAFGRGIRSERLVEKALATRADEHTASERRDPRQSAQDRPVLRALLAESGALPALAMIVCATAPLSPQLAREAERRSGAPLLEIYGCTESGQLASRRPVLSNEWEPWPGVRVETRVTSFAT